MLLKESLLVARPNEVHRLKSFVVTAAVRTLIEMGIDLEEFQQEFAVFAAVRRQDVSIRKTDIAALGERDGIFRDRFAVFGMRLEVRLFQGLPHESFAPLCRVAVPLFRFLRFRIV